MAHVVILTSNMAGRVNISTELSRRLVEAGHEVTIAGTADLERRIADQGGVFVRLGRSSSERDERVGSGTASNRSIAARRAAAVEALDSEGFLRTLHTLQPDLLLIDMELSMHVIAAASTRIPIARWPSMLSVWKRPGLPPLHSPIIPGQGWSGSTIGIEWAWLKFRAGKWLAIQRNRLQRRGTDRISVLRSLSERVGFPFDQEAARFDWLVPFTFRSLPVLSFNALELEFPHKPHPNCRYVGPVLALDRPTPAWSAASANRLGEIFAAREADDRRSLIYCSFGAWHKGDDLDFLRRVVDAVSRHPDWDLVVGLGGRFAADALGGLPDNVHVFEWAPQLETLAHADVAIHHAGISSVNECLAAGVPMVVYPFAFLDQPGNAARVDYHGLGEVGDRESDTSEAIEGRIERLLSASGPRDVARRMQAVVDGYQRQHRALSAIEELLDNGRA